MVDFKSGPASSSHTMSCVVAFKTVGSDDRFTEKLVGGLHRLGTDGDDTMKFSHVELMIHRQCRGPRCPSLYRCSHSGNRRSHWVSYSAVFKHSEKGVVCRADKHHRDIRKWWYVILEDVDPVELDVIEGFAASQTNKLGFNWMSLLFNHICLMKYCFPFGVHDSSGLVVDSAEQKIDDETKTPLNPVVGPLLNPMAIPLPDPMPMYCSELVACCLLTARYMSKELTPVPSAITPAELYDSLRLNGRRTSEMSAVKFYSRGDLKSRGYKDFYE